MMPSFPIIQPTHTEDMAPQQTTLSSALAAGPSSIDKEPTPTSTSGPSAADWETHKEEITQLYKSTTMKNLLMKMEQKYRFKASKRMYETKFRKWGVYKNMSKAVKAAAINSLRSDGSQTRPTTLAKAQHWKRIVRHQRSFLREIQGLLRVLEEPSTSRGCSQTLQGAMNFAGAAIPPIPLTPTDDSRTRRQEEILKCVDACCQLQQGNRAELDNVLGVGASSNMSPEPQSFWDDVKHAIYFTKIGSKTPASCGSMEEILNFETSRFTSFEFVWELFATLSPVNTATCADLRQRILASFLESLDGKVPELHPIRKLCALLLCSADDSGISVVSLSRARDSFNQKLGHDHPASCSLQRLIIGLARRDRNLSVAETLAQDLYTKVHSSGPHTTLARQCARTLSHVLIDVRKLDLARAYCLSVVRSTPLRKQKAHDRFSVQSLEDLAEIERLDGKLGLSFQYLLQARTSAEVLWPGQPALKHMEEKLASDTYTPLSYVSSTNSVQIFG